MPISKTDAADITTTKLCVDVHYTDNTATVAGVFFTDWARATPIRTVSISTPVAADYEPGAFYKRELPCILELLDSGAFMPGLIIVDGYVWLGTNRPGLGHHLFTTLGEMIPVIGVAKNYFEGALDAVPIVRSKSKRPLYVTAAGVPVAEAAERVRTMHGSFRMPTLLKRADQLCRSRA